MSSLSSTDDPLNSISGGCAGRGAAREHDELGRQAPLGAVRRRHRQRVRVDEPGRPFDQRNVVPQQLVADDVPLPLHHLPDAERDVLDRDLVLQPVALAVDRSLVQPRQVEDRLADRLRRNRPRVDADTADRGVPLDQRDALAELRRLDRRLLARRPRADDDDLELRAHRGSFSARGLHGNGVTVCSSFRLRKVSRARARSRRADRPCRRSPSSPGRRRSRAARPCRRGKPRPGRGWLRSHDR